MASHCSEKTSAQIDFVATTGMTKTLAEFLHHTPYGVGEARVFNGLASLRLVRI